MARLKVQYEAALDEKGIAFAKDMRQLTSAYKEATDELSAQGEQLREARRQHREADAALMAGLEEAARRVDAAENRLREQSLIAAQLAGHASSALQQELLSIFGARDLLSSAAIRSAASASAALPPPSCASSATPMTASASSVGGGVGVAAGAAADGSPYGAATIAGGVPSARRQPRRDMVGVASSLLPVAPSPS